jgi:uncharacterized protein YjiS (DUF1127 family)
MIMTAQIRNINLQVLAVRPAGLKPLVSGAIQWLHAAYERHRQRDVLLKLDDRMLSDIGVSRADAYHEGSKPFWKE